MHIAESCIPQWWSVSPARAVPEHRRLSLTHCFRGRLAPGGSDELGGGQVVQMEDGP